MSQVNGKIGFILQKFTLGANFFGTPQCRNVGKSTVNGSEGFSKPWECAVASSFFKSQKWRIRKYHNLDAKENLRGRNALWLFRFVHSSIHLSNHRECATILPSSIHPSIHPSQPLHPFNHLSTHPINSVAIKPSFALSLLINLSMCPFLTQPSNPCNYPCTHPLSNQPSITSQLLSYLPLQLYSIPPV